MVFYCRTLAQQSLDWQQQLKFYRATKRKQWGPMGLY